MISELRAMWPEELKRFSDAELAKEYEDFKASENGNDDSRFLEWIVATDG